MCNRSQEIFFIFVIIAYIMSDYIAQKPLYNPMLYREFYGGRYPACARIKKENPGTIAVPGFLLESNYLLEN